MIQIFEWLEATWIATFVRESPSLLGYTAFLSLHAMGLAIVVGINTAIALRLLGFARGVPVAPLLKLFPVMYAGFTVNTISGAGLFAASATSLISNAMFLWKIAFVVLGIVSIELLRAKVFSGDALQSDGALPPRAKMYACLSIFCWFAAIVSGRLTAYPNFVSTLLGN
jgi:hypothetical protein